MLSNPIASLVSALVALRFPSAARLRTEFVNFLRLQGQPGGFAGLDDDGTVTSYLKPVEIQALHDGPVNAQTGNPTYVFNPQELVQAFKDAPNLAGALQGIIDARIAAGGGAPANAAPVVSAGADNTIVLPTSSVTLPGSATDSDGTIASRSWSQSSGPAGAVISTATNGTATVTGLVQGTYGFRFTATDDRGATSADEVIVTVQAAPASGGGAGTSEGTSLTGPLLSTDNDQLSGGTLTPINAASANGWHRSVAALKFAADAIGWVQFKLSDAPGSGSVILSPDRTLPAGPAYNNKHATNREYGKLVAIYEGSNRGGNVSAPNFADVRLRLDFLAVNGAQVHSVIYEYRAPNATAWTQYASSPSGSVPLYLRFFTYNASVISSISTAGTIAA